jgi:hypothetical protein
MKTTVLRFFFFIALTLCIIIIIIIIKYTVTKFYPIMDSEQRLLGGFLSQLSACHKKFYRYYTLTPCYENFAR